MNERTLTQRVARYLRQQPDIWELKVHGGRYQRHGIPDFLLCVRGLFVAIELKAPDGNHPVSRLQALNLSRIRDAGGLTAVATSVDEVREIIEAARSKKGV